jgi:hypothetical protein
MRDTIERYWAHYFYSGSIALIVSWVLLMTMSGCRFGNHVDDGVAPDIGASGYYSTRPTSYTVSTFQTTGSSHVLQMSVASVPGILRNYFTDPTTLLMLDAASGSYAVFPPSNGSPSSYQLISLAANGKAFGASEELGWAQAWTDPACQINTTYTILGSINPLAASDPSSIALSIGRVPLKGRLSLKATYETTFQGDCSSSWRGMQDCYQNLASCPGSTAAQQGESQAVAQDTYKFWIQAGALLLSEIGTTNDLRFDVSYQ